MCIYGWRPGPAPERGQGLGTCRARTPHPHTPSTPEPLARRELHEAGCSPGPGLPCFSAPLQLSGSPVMAGIALPAQTSPPGALLVCLKVITDLHSPNYTSSVLLFLT